MQGLESLNQFKSFISSLGGLGRYEDTYVVHAAEGETVVPMEVLDKNPILKKRLFKTMTEMGIEPGRYIVGNELNSINPITGQPEFFLKKIVKRIKKGLGDIAPYAAPIAGAFFGPGVGAAVGAGLGAFRRDNPGDPNQALQMALLGGGSGIATNLAGGQGMLKGAGLSGANLTSPSEVFSRFTGKGGLDNLKNYFMNEDGNFKVLDSFSGKNTDSKTLSQEALSAISQISDDDERAKVLDILNKKDKGFFQGMSLGQIASLYGLGTAALGFLIDKTTPKGENAEPFEPTITNKQIFTPKPFTEYFSNTGMADGGVMDLQQGGESVGPGTGTSDSIPAMLSDGEFVMTAKAVRGAGGGDRREGARRMYEMMDNLERTA